jgi:glutamate synthase domain-containing protein 2
MEQIWEFITGVVWYWYVLAFIVIVALYDIFNKKHIILRNFPVVGHIRYWLESIGPELRQYIVANNREELADIMKATGKGPDFITVDGGEGRAGDAPPIFGVHVSLPWFYGFKDLYQIFQKREMTQDIVFIASGKLGFPAKAAIAFYMGADVINVAREAIISIGCIQAQACHNNTCPTGIATQNKWLRRGIVVPEKADRLASYFKKFNKELLEITHVAGYGHPCQFDMRDVDVSVGDSNMTQTL